MCYITLFGFVLCVLSANGIQLHGSMLLWFQSLVGKVSPRDGSALARAVCTVGGVPLVGHGHEWRCGMVPTSGDGNCCDRKPLVRDGHKAVTQNYSALCLIGS